LFHICNIEYVQSALLTRVQTNLFGASGYTLKIACDRTMSIDSRKTIPRIVDIVVAVFPSESIFSGLYLL